MSPLVSLEVEVEIEVGEVDDAEVDDAEVDDAEVEVEVDDAEVEVEVDDAEVDDAEVDDAEADDAEADSVVMPPLLDVPAVAGPETAVSGEQDASTKTALHTRNGEILRLNSSPIGSILSCAKLPTQVVGWWFRDRWSRSDLCDR